MAVYAELDAVDLVAVEAAAFVMEEERSRQRIDPDARMSGMMMPLPSSLSAVYHLIIVVLVMVMRGM